LPVTDATTHPASLAFIETTPDSCALVRGERVLEAGFGDGAFCTDSFCGSAGWFFFGVWEEHVAIYAIAGGLPSPADVGFQCEFSQSQRKPSLLSESI